MTHVPSQFPTTRWSLVRDLVGKDDVRARRALEELCEQSWNPIYVFLRRSGSSADEARDLTQGFLARLVEKRDVGGADPARGRFRAYLLGALKHFVANERERASTKKRGGGRAPVSWDDAESWCATSRADDPADLFERRWAIDLLERAMTRLADEQTHAGKADVFEELRASLTAEGDARTQAEVGARLGISAGAVKVALHRLRKRYGELLRLEVAATVSTPGEVDAELADLRAALGRTPPAPETL